MRNLHKQRYGENTGIQSKRWFKVWAWFRKVDVLFQYATAAEVLRTAAQRGWSDGRTGGVLLNHHAGLLILAIQSKVQGGTCDVCGGNMDDPDDIRQRRGYYVHRTCAPSKDNDPAIKRCIEAFNNPTS